MRVRRNDETHPARTEPRRWPPRVAAAPAAPSGLRPPPSTRQEELEAAQDRNRKAAAALARMAVPMATEPAFQFKA